MGLDGICNVLTLESHIAITQNRYGAHSCVTSHTSMHCTQSKSHCVNSVINNHAIQFLFLKNRSGTSHRVNEPLPLTHCKLYHGENYHSSINANLILLSLCKGPFTRNVTSFIKRPVFSFSCGFVFMKNGQKNGQNDVTTHSVRLSLGDV